MKNYIFTLFVRFFVAFSGLVAFVISSKLFGAEGRGIIGYGSAVVSFFSLLMSLNLGRSFLFEAGKNEGLKQKFLPNFLAINYLLMIVAVFMSTIFWLCNSNARSFIDFGNMLAFLTLIPYYLWSFNGSTIFATLNKTTNQDMAIFVNRIILLIVILLLFLLNVKSLKVFLYSYALILSFGAIIEMTLLGNPLKHFSEAYNILKYVSESKDVHIDYLAFNLYPLILIIVSGLFLNLSDLGKLNFLLQLISFIFIVASVASIRVKAYVATNGISQYLASTKKLFLLTIFLSAILIAFTFIFLNSIFFKEHFQTFGDLAIFFLIFSLSVPGFIAYQFLYPALIEYNQIHQSMKINSLILVILVSLTYPVLKVYSLAGGVALFALFYLLVFLAQVYHYKRLNLILSLNH